MMSRLTEAPSPYRHLENWSVPDLLRSLQQEQAQVAAAVEQVLPQIEALVNAVLPRMQNGGRLFYLGAGTSGRLGVLDASECPPTFGVPEDWVVGIIAGGDQALRTPTEGAEDDPRQAWQDLASWQLQSVDFVIGIAASGTTPYVVGALEACQQAEITTGCITCNPQTPLADRADYPVEVITGPEFVTGSTRLKAGTAQKMVLNMISTAVMIRLGRVRDNRMVDMQLTNEKLIDRGSKMLVEQLGLPYAAARALLLERGSVRRALEE